MQANVGGVDRAIRIVLGLALLSLFFILDGPGRWLGLLGVVLVGTGVINWCPAYVAFGISSKRSG